MNYILPMLLSLICMLLFGFRTLLFFSAVFSIIMIIRFNGFSKKLVLWCALGGLGAYLLYLTPIFQTVFEGMMERQESDQTFGNKDYIRYATLFHYYGHHYKSTVEMFLGSGLCNRALRTSYSLEILRNEFKKMELPKSREEFESRAQLLQFLNDMEEFLLIKRSFFKNKYNN